MLAFANQRTFSETIVASRFWVKSIELIASSGEPLKRYLSAEVMELAGVVAGS